MKLRNEQFLKKVEALTKTVNNVEPDLTSPREEQSDQQSDHPSDEQPIIQEEPSSEEDERPPTYEEEEKPPKPKAPRRPRSGEEESLSPHPKERRQYSPKKLHTPRQTALPKPKPTDAKIELIMESRAPNPKLSQSLHPQRQMYDTQQQAHPLYHTIGSTRPLPTDEERARLNRMVRIKRHEAEISMLVTTQLQSSTNSTDHNITLANST
ncbi:hypothetical protein Pelo_17489 [Pelomyxa schiedti]|nr:hypothetical protein Pelo_17489 [Pelomyxa schiedti]